MAASVAGPEIERLIQLLAHLPGLGPRSAPGAASDQEARGARWLRGRRRSSGNRQNSGLPSLQWIDTQDPCTVCTDPRRDPSTIVVVADVADLWALERANATNGRYHVLGATLSPLDGVGPQDLTIDALVARAHDPQVGEIVLALNATVMAETTAPYITDLLQDANVKVTRLAHGVPVGGKISTKVRYRLPCGSERCSNPHRRN